MPLLCDLIDSDLVLSAHGSLAVPIRRVVTDSREVSSGDAFICLPGYRTEGGEIRADRHQFIPEAVARGAVALVVEQPLDPVDGVTIVRVRDTWVAAAGLAGRYYGHPSRELLMIGVTGTSGKSSTTYFVESVLHAADHRLARIGTIEYRIGETTVPAVQTTPEAPVLQALLRQSVDAGCTAAVLEVSSHALELRRVSGIAFDVAVFTNLSRDHLNFHPDMHHYLRAKGRLFEELSSGGKCSTAVVNIDDPSSEYIIAANRGALLTFGFDERADVRAREVKASLEGLSFSAFTPRGGVELTLRHLGEYSVYNAMAAVAVGTCLDIDLATIAAGLAATPPVPGRFELVDSGQNFVVAVDYAHKPDALERLLTSARHLNPCRVITVVGCGGDRDPGKRPVMGRVATELSDYVILTSDNPRSEDPQEIIHAMVAGARVVDPEAQRHVVEVDRAAAIQRAIGLAQPGDIVLVAGKGHETYQLIAGQRFDFDDRAQARNAIKARLGGGAER